MDTWTTAGTKRRKQAPPQEAVNQEVSSSSSRALARALQDIGELQDNAMAV